MTAPTPEDRRREALYRRRAFMDVLSALLQWLVFLAIVTAFIWAVKE